MSLKTNSFGKSTYYFHLTLTYKTSSLLKELDWIFVQKLLREQIQIFEFEIHALVMMDTHLHILMSTKLKNENFLSEALQKKLGILAPNAHHCEEIRSLSQYLNAYRYIYRNPIEAGICRNAESYAYSSLSALLGKGRLLVPVHDQIGLIQDAIHKVNWLNSEADYKYSKLAWSLQNM